MYESIVTLLLGLFITGGDGLKCALDPRPDDVVTTGDEGTCYSPGSRLEYTTVPGDIKDE